MRRAIIEGYDPPEGWGWCYVDEVFLDLGEDAIGPPCEDGRTEGAQGSPRRTWRTPLPRTGTSPVPLRFTGEEGLAPAPRSGGGGPRRP
jgi:hypothetical protein